MRKHGLLNTLIPGLKKSEEPKATVRKEKFGFDYPQLDEKVQAGNYSVRLSFGQPETQFCVNDGEWQNCRQDAGYHWFDWQPTTGTHRLAARTRLEGRWVKVQRTVVVL